MQSSIALVGHDLAQLRALQDWFLKFELQALPGVAEVASIGGMVKEYQVVVDPDRLRAARVTLAQVRSAIENGNAASGGSVIEMAEAEYMVRATGLRARHRGSATDSGSRERPGGARSHWATWPRSASGLSCAADWRSWMARAKWSAAS